MPREGRAPTVMVVDDEPHVVDALHALLAGSGYAVRTAPSGAMALKTMAAEPADVVVLDLAMPGLDGVETCRRLLAQWSAPVIVLSARTDERQKILALDAGADDYVTKPFATGELLARIRAALRRSRAAAEAVSLLRAGHLAIDLPGRRVTADGVPVHLTPTEFDLLRALALHPDRALTHRHLLDTVLGGDYNGALQNLRTFVKQLRQKIERDPARPRLLVTEPGIGYRFCPTAPAGANAHDQTGRRPDR